MWLALLTVSRDYSFELYTTLNVIISPIHFYMSLLASQYLFYSYFFKGFEIGFNKVLSQTQSLSILAHLMLQINQDLWIPLQLCHGILTCRVWSMEKRAPLPRSDSMRNNRLRALTCFFVGVLLPEGSLLLIVSCFCSVNRRNYAECSVFLPLSWESRNHWMCLSAVSLFHYVSAPTSRPRAWVST